MLRRVVMLALAWALVASCRFARGSPQTPWVHKSWEFQPIFDDA